MTVIWAEMKPATLDSVDLGYLAAIHSTLAAIPNSKATNWVGVEEALET